MLLSQEQRPCQQNESPYPGLWLADLTLLVRPLTVQQMAELARDKRKAERALLEVLEVERD
jgi:hypothetical protein